jgi:hypothetical protein
LTKKLAVLSATLSFASAAGAATLAADKFSVPPYTLDAPLSGQAASGFGFTGNWLSPVSGDLEVTDPGFVGLPPSPPFTTYGDYAQFSSPIALNSGQLYLSALLDNIGTGNLNNSGVNINNGSAAATLGGTGFNTDFNFATNASLGAATAQTNIAPTGEHFLVGVLDYANHQIAIFVDPTAASFYNADGTNDANAVAAWTPAVGISFLYLEMLERSPDNLKFGDLIVSNAPGTAGIGTPEPATFGLGLIAAGLLFLRAKRAAASAR